jgi:hypothetical protein
MLDDLDFEPFEKIKKLPKTGKGPNLKKRDYQIRAARKAKEKAKIAALEEIVEAEE